MKTLFDFFHGILGIIAMILIVSAAIIGCLVGKVKKIIKNKTMTEFKELNGFPEDIQENEAVWLYNSKTGFVMLGSMIYEDGWLWARSNGIICSKNGQIISECELDDDYEFTHYCKLPKLPL